MKALSQLLLCCILALPALAQRGGGMHGGAAGRGFGGGYARGGFAGGYRSGGFANRGFGYGGFRSGGFRYGGYHRGFRGNFFYGGFGFYPYAYPWYAGSWYPYSGYYDAYPPAPNVMVYPSDPPPPPVTVYEPPARPEVREYTGAPSSYQPPYEKPIYLIAFQNQDVIRAAEAYWVDGGTLHYVTLQHERKQAPLDSVDRAFSTRLNRERRVDFRLP